MKNKTAFLILISVLIIMGSNYGWASSEGNYLDEALKLNALDIFTGTDKGYELNRVPTRIEALAIYIKLLGVEEEALTYASYAPVFSDVPKWALGYANYAYYNDISKGIGGGKFGALQPITAPQYMTYILRALGYKEESGDFTLQSALQFARQSKVITDLTYSALSRESFLRDHLALTSYEGLTASTKNDDYTLAEYLIALDRLNYQKARSLNIVSDQLNETLLRVMVWYPQNATNKNEAFNMMMRLSKIPGEYMKGLIQNDVDVRFINGVITDQPEYAYLKGVTPRGWEGTGKTWDDIKGIGGNPVVVRIGYSSDPTEHGSVNLELHEIAHAMDYYVFRDLGYGSIDEAFKRIADQERKVLFGNDTYFEYYEEYFAESFAKYYFTAESRAELKRYAPLTYEMFSKLELNR